MIDDYRYEMSDEDPREMPRVDPSRQTEEEKRESAKLVQDYLYTIKNQFYPDDEKRFYQDRKFLIRCITLPARYLHKKGVMLDDAFYRKILNEVILGIKRHTKARDYTSFAGYLLVCMQRHLKHHDEDYVAKGKDIREGRGAKTAKSFVDSLKAVETPEHFTQALADLSSLVTVGGRKKPKPKAPPADPQLGLF